MTVDVFLIQDGVVANIASVSSLEVATAFYPEFMVVEKTPENSYIDNVPVNPGDAAP